MNGELSKEKRNLTFSQREGKAPLPEVLMAGELNRKFRNHIWLVIEKSLENCSISNDFTDSWLLNNKEGTYWEKCFFSYHFDIFEITHDEIENNEMTNPWHVRRHIKEVIFGKEPHHILTLLEHMLRRADIPLDLASRIEECMQFAPYIIERSDEPICIISTTSEEMKECVKHALDNINQSELTGAKFHLRNATQELNSEKFSDSIRESIHAVEAAIGQISSESKNNFKGALDSLEKNGLLKHPALKEAFIKLYGYTSDEQGIRHSLLDKESTDVGFDEAIFMYGACVSFVDYLVSKQGQTEENERA